MCSAGPEDRGQLTEDMSRAPAIFAELTAKPKLRPRRNARRPCWKQHVTERALTAMPIRAAMLSASTSR